MKIELQRRVNTQRWQVLAEIGREQKKQLFQALAKLIEEENSRGNYNTNKVALRISEELLNREGFKHYGLRLLQRFEEMGGASTNPEVRLKDEGRKLINTGSIAIPHQDTFEITVSNPDPLIPASITAYKPVPIGRHNNLVKRALEIRNKTKGKRGKDFYDAMSEVEDQASDLPTHIINLKQQSFSLLDSTTIRLNEIEKRGIPGSKPPILTLKLQVRTDSTNLILQYKKNKIQFPAPPISIHEVKEQLLSQVQRYSYSPSSGGLLVDQSQFNQLPNRVKRAFKMDIKIDNPTLRDMGSFQSTTIRDVPLIPATLEVAEQWAWYLLKERISSYIDQKDYLELCHEIYQYEKLRLYNLNLPDYNELPEKIGFGTPKYWYVQALRDLPEVNS